MDVLEIFNSEGVVDVHVYPDCHPHFNGGCEVGILRVVSNRAFLQLFRFDPRVRVVVQSFKQSLRDDE